MSALPVPVLDVTVELADSAARARSYVQDAKAPSTWRAYRTDWAHFTGWCTSRSLSALPASPETVSYYLAAHAEDLKPATLSRRLSAITWAHEADGHQSPTRSAPVRLTMSGIRRRHGEPPRQVAPATIELIRRFVEHLDNDAAGARDRALILIGFAGAFRRSELVSLDVDNVTETADGLRVMLRRSKTDQDGTGTIKALPFGEVADTCPVQAFRAWRDTAGLDDGPLFRPVDRNGTVRAARLNACSVALVIKRAAERAGLDPDAFSGHSLRAGLVTSAAAAGVPEWAIMRQTGHKSTAMVQRYIRDAQLFRNNAAAAVGL